MVPSFHTSKREYGHLEIRVEIHMRCDPPREATRAAVPSNDGTDDGHHNRCAASIAGRSLLKMEMAN